MKKTLLLAALAALAAVSATAATAFVEFTSQPSGASVYVDGERRGTTPLQLADLATAASHRVRIELKDYETVEEFVQVDDGAAIRRDYSMQPVKGLLLVTSDPEGADVSQNGYSLGPTPRLITNLNAKDFHTLVLKKTGYQDSKLAIKFDGRRPLVQNVKLVLDSGVIEIKSEPAGAEATVNGITCGVTPTVAKEVRKGRVTVELRKPGYKPETRELSVSAGDEQQLFVRLEALPGSLRLSSVPAGARFYLDDLPLPSGDTCVASDLKPGTYKVRAELKGYGTMERSVKIANGQEAVEEFRLENVMGSLEFKTSPVGATVWVDGRKRGTSVSADPNAETSDVLVIRDLLEGDHEVKIEKDGFAPWTRHIVVKSSEAVQTRVRLKKIFLPDIRITTTSGEVIEGILVRNDPSVVIVEVSFGTNRPIPRDSVRNMEPIFPEL